MAKPTPTFYVFHGADDLSSSEALADLKQRVGAPEIADLNTTVFDGGGLSIGELKHACDTVPFMAERRLVIVRGLLSRLSRRGKTAPPASRSDYLAALADYLPLVPDTTRVVFVESQALPARNPILKLAGRHERGFVRRFDPPEAKGLARWVEERVAKCGGKIEAKAARHLASVVGSDLRVLDQEVDHLLLMGGV
ncbi:MAG: hypothetical protein E3J64_07680, partial [Anaerolineales bacterium]